VSVTYTGNASADCAVVPGEVSALMTDQGLDARRVGRRPRADRYDVAGGMVSDLGADRDFSRAACLADDLRRYGGTTRGRTRRPGTATTNRPGGERLRVGQLRLRRGGAQRLVTACP